MLKVFQGHLWVRYCAKRTVHSNSMISPCILQRNRERILCETLRSRSDGFEKSSQNNSFQRTVDEKKKKTEDDRFLALIDSARNRTTREKLGLTYICGAALIRGAIEKGILLPEIYFHNFADLQALPHQTLVDAGVEFVAVSRQSFIKKFSTELCTDGLLAVFAIPFHQRLSKNRSNEHQRLPLTLICDNIRDPGNMGKIIQSAVAIDADRILVTKGCVDVWDPKVLQVAHGAHFDALIQTNLNWKEIGDTLPTECAIYLADSSPVEGGSNASKEKNDGQDMEEKEEEEACGRLCEYDDIDYCSGSPHAVVVIGGETMGISRQAFDLSQGISRQAFDLSQTKKRPGRRIHVPMMSGIDSLNSAVAGSIILFEIGRQMKLKSLP